MKKYRWTLTILFISAATLFVIVSFTTDPNNLVGTQIQHLFSPKKEVTQSIEGQDEQIEVTRNEGTNVDYVIYVDEDRYKMMKGEQEDVITTIEPLPDPYPPVSLSIKQIKKQEPKDVVEVLEETLKQNFPQLHEVEHVTKPVEGYLLHGVEGNEATSKVVHAYVVSNQNGGSFILQQNYFLEAAEGHGARFYHMLESFKVIKK